MNWLKNKIAKPQFELAEYGILKLEKNRSEYKWFGRVTLPISNNPIELIIEVEKRAEPSREQVQLIKNFESNWQNTEKKLFEYMAETWRDSKWEKDKTALKKMYSLSAIDLKKGNVEWWIVLEPEFHVDTIFNFLLIFSLMNDEIIWSNLK